LFELDPDTISNWQPLRMWEFSPTTREEIIQAGLPVTVHKVPGKVASRIGQLSLKEEAAGKVRVFAMVDIWTQSVLKPLHSWLFSLFEKLPNDGTHNQDAAFIRAQEKAVRYNQAYCYDLSAATDRLPIRLQVSILDSLFNHIEPEVQYVGMTYGTA